MTDKKVDESWKDKVSTEKSAEPEVSKEASNEVVKETTQAPAQETAQEEAHTHEMPPVDFNLFVSSLGMQALMGLGEIENPMTNKKEKSLPQAKYLIDTLAMVKEKTKGNLDEQESKMIEQMLYQLQMKFVELSK